MHLPKSENTAASSLILDAPTVIPWGAYAGVVRHESQSLLPAAVTTTIPSELSFSTASTRRSLEHSS